MPAYPEKLKEQARARKRRQRDRARDADVTLGGESVTDVTVSVTKGPEMSRSDVTPWNPLTEARDIPWTDEHGVPRMTHYEPPIGGWKGMGWCRDCNTKVPAKDNCCRPCFFGS